MITESLISEQLHKDERWKKVLARFSAIEIQLQELYWEVLDRMDDDKQPRATNSNRLID